MEKFAPWNILTLFPGNETARYEVYSSYSASKIIMVKDYALIW